MDNTPNNKPAIAEIARKNDENPKHQANMEGKENTKIGEYEKTKFSQ